MTYKQAEPTPGEDTPKICVSKMNFNRPQISFNLFQKIDFGGWTLCRGGGGQKKASKIDFPNCRTILFMV